MKNQTNKLKTRTIENNQRYSQLQAHSNCNAFNARFFCDYWDYLGKTATIIVENSDGSYSISEKKIENDRLNQLQRIAVNLPLIKGNEYDDQSIIEVMREINNKVCEPPLPESVLDGLIAITLCSFPKKSLKVPIGMVFVSYPTTEGKTYLQVKGNGKAEKLMLIYMSIFLLQFNGELITQKEVVNKLGVKLRTVQRYWKPFKEEVERYNKALAAG